MPVCFSKLSSLKEWKKCDVFNVSRDEEKQEMLCNSPVVTQALIFVITAIMSGWLLAKLETSRLFSQMIVLGVAVYGAWNPSVFIPLCPERVL